jgi:transketolase
VPTCIVAHTVKGKGVRYMELSRTWHLGYLGPEDERAATLEITRDG